jgi:hypothetical protein
MQRTPPTFTRDQFVSGDQAVHTVVVFAQPVGDLGYAKQAQVVVWVYIGCRHATT